MKELKVFAGMVVFNKTKMEYIPMIVLYLQMKDQPMMIRGQTKLNF